MPAGSTGPYAYTVYDAKTKEPVEGGTDTIPSTGGTISLTGGQYAVMEGLPAGTAYTVTEQEANQDGYVTTATNASGTVTVGGENEVHFTNCRAPGIWSSRSRSPAAAATGARSGLSIFP